MAYILGVRSLANASRARQFKPPWGGVGTASSNKYGSRGRSCAVVRGRAWSCAVVRGRACVVGHSWSFVVICGHSWSCAVGRAWSCAVGRGRAVLPASRPARQPALPRCPLRGQHCRDTNERTKEGTKEGTNNI